MKTNFIKGIIFACVAALWWGMPQPLFFDEINYIPSLEVQSIYRKLEGVVDNYYDVASCITNGEDYADCVDKLVESMEQN